MKKYRKIKSFKRRTWKRKQRIKKKIEILELENKQLRKEIKEYNLYYEEEKNLSPNNKKQLSFNFTNNFQSFQELSLPLNLQMTINNVVPRIVGIASNLYQFMKDEGYMKLPLAKWMYFFMYASSFLAMNFLLEQNISDK